MFHPIFIWVSKIVHQEIIYWDKNFRFMYFTFHRTLGSPNIAVRCREAAGVGPHTGSSTATKWAWPTQIHISDAVMRRWMKTTGRREEAPALEEMK
ncbi:hypothetical protein YC2023_035502 [Brassica napus]